LKDGDLFFFFVKFDPFCKICGEILFDSLKPIGIICKEFFLGAFKKFFVNKCEKYFKNFLISLFSEFLRRPSDTYNKSCILVYSVERFKVLIKASQIEEANLFVYITFQGVFKFPFFVLVQLLHEKL
jgi:hypothetical protein